MSFAGIESESSKENGKKLRRQNLHPKALLHSGKAVRLGKPSTLTLGSLRGRPTFTSTKGFVVVKKTPGYSEEGAFLHNEVFGLLR